MADQRKPKPKSAKPKAAKPKPKPAMPKRKAAKPKPKAAKAKIAKPKPAKRSAKADSLSESQPPRDLQIEDDFLDDLDAELDDIIAAPTEEHPAPGGAVAPEAGDQDDVENEDSEQDAEDDLDDQESGEEDADFDADADGDEEEAEQPTGVLAAITGRLPKIPGRGGGRSAGGGQTGFGRPRRRFPLWARFAAGSFIVIASIAAATAASLILYLTDFARALEDNVALQGVQGKLAQIHPGAPQTIMIIGSDKRPEEIEAGLNGRSDTTILLRLDPARNAIALFSIPRDLIVTIPGHGVDMFNAAYSIGGPQLTLQTVKDLTGLEVNHLVNVNFRGFAKAVQAIGCVYVDVDRRYFHSNQGLPPSAQYSEIDVRPGYQRLCGFKALEYVRYRHGDNDVVRSARQQDFLREARARVPAEKLFSDRHELIKIFTDYTTSDINDAGTLLEVLKQFVAARDEPVKEIHFEGNIGNRVTTTPEQIKTAVNQFLGIQGTAGPRGSSTANPEGTTPAPEAPPAPTVSKSEQKAAAKAGTAGPKKLDQNAQGLEAGTFGKKLAYRIRRRNRTMPIYYPTTVIAGSQYAARPRAYNLQDHSLSPDETFSYKFVLKTVDNQYYGLQGTRWTDAPILDEPHETKEVGDRTYDLYYDNDRLRMVSWHYHGAVFWVSNSLLQGLTADQMIAIARGCKLLAPPAA
ncbi:MAG: LCP family protein [Solirubrobacterales bacterium]